MYKDEILSSRLAHYTRVSLVLMYVLAYRLPHTLENACRAREMHPRKIGMVETYISYDRSASIYQVDHAVWQPCLLQYHHKYAGRIYLCISKLPYHYIAAHGWSSRQVTTDSGKVKWGHSQHKPFQRTVLHPVMYTRCRYWLLLIYFS